MINLKGILLLSDQNQTLKKISRIRKIRKKKVQNLMNLMYQYKMIHTLMNIHMLIHHPLISLINKLPKLNHLSVKLYKQIRILMIETKNCKYLNKSSISLKMINI